MDLDFLNSPRESQIDWLTTMIQNEIPQPQLPATSLESTPPLPTLYTRPSTSASQISFNLPSAPTTSVVATPAYDPFQAFKPKTVEEMRELVFCMAALQPVHIDPESIKPPKRRHVRISKDPQSVAARLRRERISERIRILQRLVPGGTKMDTVSMLDEAVQYMKFLKNQVKSMQRATSGRSVHGLFLSATGIGLDKIQYPAFAKPAQLLS